MRGATGGNGEVTGSGLGWKGNMSGLAKSQDKTLSSDKQLIIPRTEGRQAYEVNNR